MERAARWRGDPRASDRQEFLRAVRYIKPSKKDVFFDLGCGYGGPCIWIAPKVKLSVGIEDHYFRYLHARRDVEKSGLENIRILWDDVERVSYRKATILYSVIYIGFGVIEKIQRETRTGSEVVLYGLPPFPLKFEKLFDSFCRLTTPFERVEDEDEFARIYLGRKKATMKKLLRLLDREQARDLRREIREADVNWNSLIRT